MDGHLVTIKVGVKSRTDQRMKLDSLSLDQYHFKGLHTQPVQSGCPVENHRILAHDIIEHVPYLFGPLFHHLAGTLDSGYKSLGFKLIVDKRLKQLQGHFFRETALVQPQVWADHNNGTTGIVDTFTEQILAEAPLFAFQHV